METERDPWEGEQGPVALPEPVRGLECLDLRIPLRGGASGWGLDGDGDLAEGVVAAVVDGDTYSTPPACRGGCGPAGMQRRIRSPIRTYNDAIKLAGRCGPRNHSSRLARRLRVVGHDHRPLLSPQLRPAPVRQNRVFLSPRAKGGENLEVRPGQFFGEVTRIPCFIMMIVVPCHNDSYRYIFISWRIKRIFIIDLRQTIF